MEHRLARVLAYPQFRARLSSFFAIFALALAAIGLHGVVQQFTAQRKHEIGIRRAIGAGTRHIVGLVIRQGGIPIVIGLGCGVALALVVSRYLSSLLYGVQPGDRATLAGSVLVLAVVAGLSIALPAWRAAHVDPMQTLRE
jgi:ABC-type antimicrobial peptide transport system permease subunit